MGRRESRNVKLLQSRIALWLCLELVPISRWEYGSSHKNRNRLSHTPHHPNLQLSSTFWELRPNLKDFLSLPFFSFLLFLLSWSSCASLEALSVELELERRNSYLDRETAFSFGIVSSWGWKNNDRDTCQQEAKRDGSSSQPLLRRYSPISLGFRSCNITVRLVNISSSCGSFLFPAQSPLILGETASTHSEFQEPIGTATILRFLMSLDDNICFKKVSSCKSPVWGLGSSKEYLGK